jgi:hypothetical protein
MNQKELSTWISEALDGQGFARGKHGWYHRGRDCLVMLSLDKSPYGGQYHITLAASPFALLDAEEPREHKLHFRVRLESLVDDPTRTSSGLDLENVTMSAEERRQIVQQTLKSKALPLLTSLTSVKGMADALSGHPRVGAFMARTALRDHLAKELERTFP